MKAVFLDFGTYYPDGLDTSALESSVPEFVFHDYSALGDVAARIEDADIVLSNKVVLDADLIAVAENLKLIVSGATGFNHIDVIAAKAAGIPVSNVRGYSTPCVSQHVFTLILALRSKLLEYHDDVKRGRWQETRDFCFLDYPIHELHEHTLGIIGYGALGRNVQNIAQAFGMKVIVADRKGADTLRDGRMALEEVIAQADILTLHCPLTDETRDLITAVDLHAMKDSALLINTARGGVVNEADLAQALRDGEIAGAGVDVLSQEPPSDGNPLLDPEIQNLIVTPHVAWASRQACQRLFDQVVDVIEAFKAGAPMNVVNP